MPAQTGERAEKTGTFHCRGCDEAVRVKKGDRVPECPCGGTTFESRTHESRTQETTTRRKRRKSGKSPKSAARRTSRGRAAKKKAA